MRGATGFAGPGFSVFFDPYHDEYSYEFLNSRVSPQTLHLPELTAPFGGSMTQWCGQVLGAAATAGRVAAFFGRADIFIARLPL